MKRRTMIEYQDASPEVKAIYDEIMKVTGSTTVPNILKALGNNGNVLRATWSKVRYAVLEGEVPLLLKELILFNMASRAGDEYCTAFHGNTALNLDKSLSCDDLIRLSQGKGYDRLPRSFKIAVDVVTQAALNPKSVAAEEFNFENQLRDEGFSESEIDDIFDVPPEGPFPPPQG
jgi:hypothetical protein